MMLRILAATFFAVSMILLLSGAAFKWIIIDDKEPVRDHLRWTSTDSGYFKYTYDCIEGKKFLFVQHDRRSLGVTGPLGDCPNSTDHISEEQ